MGVECHTRLSGQKLIYFIMVNAAPRESTEGSSYTVDWAESIIRSSCLCIWITIKLKVDECGSGALHIVDK